MAAYSGKPAHHHPLLPKKPDRGCCAASMVGGFGRLFAILRLCCGFDSGFLVSAGCNFVGSEGGCNCANASRTRTLAETSATAVCTHSGPAAYSASGMPLTMRVPQNGGSGTGLSARTVRRAGARRCPFRFQGCLKRTRRFWRKRTKPPRKLPHVATTARTICWSRTSFAQTRHRHGSFPNTWLMRLWYMQRNRAHETLDSSE